MVKRAILPKLDALMFFDYKQVEYRLLAYYLAATLGDNSMAEVFIRGDDLHEESARSILGLPADHVVTEAERDVGKTYNFLTIYGGGAYKASQSLGVPLGVAREQQEKFHATWPGIKQMHNPPFANGGYRRGEFPGVIQQRLAERGYITTLAGRHLRPDSPHKALNCLVQGSAAELIRIAMVRVHRYLDSNLTASHLVLTIHDELVADAVRREIELLLEVIPQLMDYEPVSEIVPLGVDAEVSFTTWAEKESYDKEVHGRSRVAA